MIDLSSKIEDNLESSKLTDLKNTTAVTTKDISEIINSSTSNVEDNTSSSDSNNGVINDFNNIDDTEAQNQNIVNCLALTVKKDYSLSIVKNVVVKTFKNIWKIAVSIFTLNLLKFFM